MVRRPFENHYEIGIIRSTVRVWNDVFVGLEW